MMKDNPIYPFAVKRVRQYHKILSAYGKDLQDFLRKYRPTPFNYSFMNKWLMRKAELLGEETQQFITESVLDIIEYTIHLYNDLQEQNVGQGLSEVELEELKLQVYKEFLLKKFKGKTLDQRLTHSTKRLKMNLHRELKESILQHESGIRQSTKNIVNTITGRDYQYGGTAYRWNTRLVLSEMFRAYQFSAKATLIQLGVKEVAWVNSPRHQPGDKLIDEYAKETYKPKDLPEYPYPCNDSYFIPIYK